jgi:UDP-N-acetylmuramoyl-L-alanyl-D-glutamate--2,6-diaminopimelate ligase
VINADDPYGQRLENLTRAKVVRYGIRAAQAQVRASGIRYTLQGSEFTLCTPEGCAEIFSPLIGAYNVYNVLAAAATGVQLGFSLPEISRALRTFSQVPGRLEKVTREEPFSVFVDYAHTEDALANVIRSLRDVSSGRILVLFGCGGDRDKDKRPQMGRVVTEDADYAVITSDNPRSEDPAEIIAQIRSGIRKENHCVVPDREEAICRIISLARPGDVVLLAGKGHEQYQVLRERTVFFDDREVAKKCLRSRNS